MIKTDHISLNSEANSKRGIITEMAYLLSSIDPDSVMDVVMAREKLGSTGIGHGVAIPHGRMPDLAGPVLVLARHAEGVDFDSIDGKPVHIVVLLLVPDSDDRQHLELLAQLARNLQQESFRNQIMQAEDCAAMAALFAGKVTID